MYFFNASKKGGFASIIGFMLTFFVILTVFFGLFYSYHTEIVKQSNIIEDFEKKASFHSSNYGYDYYLPYYSSGRMNFYFENLGKKDIEFKYKNNYCFNYYINSKYLSSQNIFMNPQGHIASNYSIIEANSVGYLSLKDSFDFTSQNNFLAVSCEGIEKPYTLNPTKLDWWNNNWQKREKINIKNNVNSNLAEYQVEIDLNSANFDFESSTKDDIRVLLPLKEQLILDLTFDNYGQTITDYSKNSLDVYLGNDSNSNSNDPSKASGVIFNALKFDGNSSIITIPSHNMLEQDNSITYSAWIKWDDSGDTTQNLITNGANSNSIQIINDGGTNDNKLQFNLNISGSSNSIKSNTTLNTKWHHVTATYDGSQMKLYLDSNLVANKSVIGTIDTFSSDNYIGSAGKSSYFSGLIDEVKIFNTNLNKDEIENLYYNNLRFRELDYHVASFDATKKEAKIFAKIPAISSQNNVIIHLYYNNLNATTTSSMEQTFSYTTPRTTGYVLSDKISQSNGLSILSLYDNNTIIVGTNEFNLDSKESNTLASGSLSLDDEIKTKYLANIEGNANTDDIIAPISWASTEFYYGGFSDTNETFCIISPWGSANVDIYDDGSNIWSGSIDSNGNCVTLNIATNNAFRLSSDIPVLVSYYGLNSDSNSFVLYPATKDSLYGVPSQNLRIASGPSGADIQIYDSSGSHSTQSLTSDDLYTDSSNGADGNADAYKILTDNLIGAIQQDDSDGLESTVFVPEYEMGTKFGSNQDAEYIAIASPYSDANCTIYDETGSIVNNLETGGGSNGIYKYEFGTGPPPNIYANSGWHLECDKPVWPYYEDNANDDETNLIGHPQIRQYIYPEPTVEFE
jgi:hypothetical protein